MLSPLPDVACSPPINPSIVFHTQTELIMTALKGTSSYLIAWSGKLSLKLDVRGARSTWHTVNYYNVTVESNCDVKFSDRHRIRSFSLLMPSHASVLSHLETSPGHVFVSGGAEAREAERVEMLCYESIYSPALVNYTQHDIMHC